MLDAPFATSDYLANLYGTRPWMLARGYALTLGQYEANFRDNKIDADCCRSERWYIIARGDLVRMRRELAEHTTEPVFSPHQC